MKLWIGGDPSFKLLYRLSRDGLSKESFSQNCDKKGPTIVVIKSKEGKVFGGYASIDFDKSNPNKSFKLDQKSFLFSLTHLTKHKQKDTETKIMFYDNYPFAFGKVSEDLYIACNNYAQYGNSTKNFGNNYELPNGIV